MGKTNNSYRFVTHEVHHFSLYNKYDNTKINSYFIFKWPVPYFDYNNFLLSNQTKTNIEESNKFLT